MGAILDNMETIKDICTRTGVPVDTATKRWRRARFGAFSVHFVPTPEQYAVLFRDGQQDNQDGKRINVLHSDRTPETIKDKIVGQEQEGDGDKIEGQGQEVNDKDRTKKKWLWPPLLLASIASIGNMYLIFSHLTAGELVASVLLTALFSGSAMCFILAGIRGFWAQLVTWFLIGFECFCNVTGVYYGLLGRTGTPTRFLGMVTDILGSGTHYTAIALGLSMALIIGAVQVLSIKKIIK